VISRKIIILRWLPQVNATSPNRTREELGKGLCLSQADNIPITPFTCHNRR
jgi:hypothetical protein